MLFPFLVGVVFESASRRRRPARRSRLGRLSEVALSVTAAVLLGGSMASPAEACSVDANYIGTLPESGCALPGGGSILLVGSELSASELTLRVNGVEADLEAGPVVFSEAGPGLLLKPLADLQEGDIVNLAGRACIWDSCVVESEYVVVAPIDTNRAPPQLTVVGMHRWGDGEGCEATCSSQLHGRAYFSVDFATDAVDEGPVLVEAETWGAAGPYASTLFLARSTSEYASLALPAREEGHACVRARTIGLFGGPSSWSELECDACDAVDDSAVSACQLPEPSWNAACGPSRGDSVDEDSWCELPTDAAAGSGGEPSDRDSSPGCACSTAAPTSGCAPWLGLCFVFGLLALRRARSQAH